MCRDEREMGRERDLSVRERKDFMNKEKNLPDEKDRDCRTSKIAFIRDTERVSRERYIECECVLCFMIEEF